MMILYGNSISPYVRKVLVYGAEKGLEFDLRMAGMGTGGDDFVEASPFRKMPGFRDEGAGEDGGDFTICDSTAIIAYLEAKYPEPNLIPKSPAAHARTIWYEEFGDTILMGAGRKMFFNRLVSPRFLKIPGNLEEADLAERDELPPILDYLESVIPASGFLVEDRLTLADLAVASPFVNMGHINVIVDPATYPRTAAYVEAILARPSFATLVAAERAFLAR